MTDEKLSLEDLFEGKPYINIYEQDKDDIEGVITENDIKTFFRCGYAYFLKRHIGLAKIPRAAGALQSLMFQQARKSLFNLRDPKKGRFIPYQINCGKGCKPAQNMTAEELAQHLAYSDAETFGNSLSGKWLYFTAKNMYANSPISWMFDGQKGIVGRQLKTAAENYYRFVMENGAPILGFQNTTETFSLDGLLLNVRLPEVRKGLIIDDPTMWGFNADEKYDAVKNNIETSSLVTLRILALCTALHELPLYQDKLLSLEEKRSGIAERYGHNGKRINPQFRYRHFNASENILTETSRDDSHIDRLKTVIEMFMEGTRREDYQPKHRSCGGCQYNLLDENGEPVCRKARKGVKPSVPEHYFRKRAFETEILEWENPEHKMITSIVGKVHRKDKSALKAAQYDLQFEDIEDGTLAISHYESNAHGIGFEERILEETDRFLQEKATKSGKEIIHRIDFEKDFKYAGQRKIEAKLTELKYEGFKKTYKPEQ